MQLSHVVLKRRERDTNHLGLTVDLLLGASRGRQLLDSASHDGSHAGLNNLAASATQACRLDYPREAREEDDQNDHAQARHFSDLMKDGRDRQSCLGGAASGSKALGLRELWLSQPGRAALVQSLCCL